MLRGAFPTPTPLLSVTRPPREARQALTRLIPGTQSELRERCIEIALKWVRS